MKTTKISAQPWAFRCVKRHTIIPPVPYLGIALMLEQSPGTGAKSKELVTASVSSPSWWFVNLSSLE